jgi:DNA-binding LytR/AlgR family response regulator
MKIAICDDESLCRAHVLDLANDYMEERKDVDVLFDVFSSPTALLDATRKGKEYDIYVLDIIMPDVNGIELGRALRENGAEGKIIYLTSSKEYALDSFKVRAFDYLLKPVDKETFFRVIDEAINSIHIKRDKCMIIKTREGSARAAFDSILYASQANRALFLRLTESKALESTTLRCPFSEAVAELLADKRFAQCGVSTVVNLHHITSVENEGIIFDSGERMFLNKRICRELRAAWNNYWIMQES